MDAMRKEMLRILGYSGKAVDVLEAELHYGEIGNATLQAKHQAGCGDVLILDLRIEDAVIRDAAFRFVGCSGIQASASAMTELIIGMTVDEAEKLTMQDIIAWLDGIPENKYECAEAAEKTLRTALAEYRQTHAESGD
ncbi:MAG: iron-sulfur cluster assembly scaffold protein [Bacteroidetes bacterium]|nr:iron-sulfur cluster assembly scaffold protein [Bacteroidota bacterium]